MITQQLIVTFCSESPYYDKDSLDILIADAERAVYDVSRSHKDVITTTYVGDAPLRQTVDNVWCEHKDYPKEDWLTEVENYDTTVGYWEWVENQMAGSEIN